MTSILLLLSLFLGTVGATTWDGYQTYLGTDKYSVSDGSNGRDKTCHKMCAALGNRQTSFSADLHIATVGTGKTYMNDAQVLAYNGASDDAKWMDFNARVRVNCYMGCDAMRWGKVVWHNNASDANAIRQTDRTDDCSTINATNFANADNNALNQKYMCNPTETNADMAPNMIRSPVTCRRECYEKRGSLPGQTLVDIKDVKVSASELATDACAVGCIWGYLQSWTDGEYRPLRTEASKRWWASNMFPCPRGNVGCDGVVSADLSALEGSYGNKGTYLDELILYSTSPILRTTPSYKIDEEDQVAVSDTTLGTCAAGEKCPNSYTRDDTGKIFPLAAATKCVGSTYQDTASQTSCNACNDGNEESSNDGTRCVCKPTFEKTGDWNNSWSTNRCVACSAGYACPGQTTGNEYYEDSDICPSNQYSQASASTCSVCDGTTRAGVRLTWKDSARNDKLNGSTECLCEFNGTYYSASQTNTDGEAGGCFECTLGYRCPDKLNRVKCNETGNEYADSEMLVSERTECLVVPTNARARSNFETQKVDCNPGYYGTFTKTGDETVRSCLACPAGSACEGGWTDGCTSATDCYAKEGSPWASGANGQKPCSLFDDNTVADLPIQGYQPDTAQASCLRCASWDGQRTNAVGEKAGAFGARADNDAKANSVCALFCDNGFFEQVGAMTGNSTQFTNNLTTNADMASRCQPCPRGSHCNGKNATPCGGGEWQDLVGQSSCKNQTTCAHVTTITKENEESYSVPNDEKTACVKRWVCPSIWDNIAFDPDCSEVCSSDRNLTTALNATKGTFTPTPIQLTTVDALGDAGVLHFKANVLNLIPESTGLRATIQNAAAAPRTTGFVFLSRHMKPSLNRGTTYSALNRCFRKANNNGTTNFARLEDLIPTEAGGQPFVFDLRRDMLTDSDAQHCVKISDVNGEETVTVWAHVMYCSSGLSHDQDIDLFPNINKSPANASWPSVSVWSQSTCQLPIQFQRAWAKEEPGVVTGVNWEILSSGTGMFDDTFVNDFMGLDSATEKVGFYNQECDAVSTKLTFTVKTNTGNNTRSFAVALSAPFTAATNPDMAPTMDNGNLTANVTARLPKWRPSVTKDTFKIEACYLKPTLDKDRNESASKALCFDNQNNILPSRLIDVHAALDSNVTSFFYADHPYYLKFTVVDPIAIALLNGDVSEGEPDFNFTVQEFFAGQNQSSNITTNNDENWFTVYGRTPNTTGQLTFSWNFLTDSTGEFQSGTFSPGSRRRLESTAESVGVIYAAAEESSTTIQDGFEAGCPSVEQQFANYPILCTLEVDDTTAEKIRLLPSELPGVSRMGVNGKDGSYTFRSNDQKCSTELVVDGEMQYGVVASASADTFQASQTDTDTTTTQSTATQGDGRADAEGESTEVEGTEGPETGGSSGETGGSSDDADDDAETLLTVANLDDADDAAGLSTGAIIAIVVVALAVVGGLGYYLVLGRRPPPPPSTAKTDLESSAALLGWHALPSLHATKQQ